MSNLKNILRFKISGARPEEEFEIIEDVDDDVPSDEEEGEIIEEEDADDDEENNDDESEEEEEVVKEPKKSEPQKSSPPPTGEKKTSSSSNKPKVAPRSFFKVRKITGLPLSILFRIINFMQLYDVTKSFFPVCKNFNKINLKTSEVINEKVFLPSEYELFMSSKGLSRKMLMYLLKFKHLDVKIIINENVNFFTYSCKKKYFNCAKYIIKNIPSFDITLFNHKGLKSSVTNGSYLIVKEIIRTKIMKDNKYNSLHRDMFNLAITKKKLEVVKVYMHHKKMDIKKDDFSCVHLAITSDALLIFKHFFETIKKKHFKLKSSHCVDMLMKIIENGRHKMLKVIIRDGKFDISRENNLPLRMASSLGHTEVVRVLLKDKRVDPSSKGSNESLMWSAEQGYYDIVKLLLKDKRVDPTVCEKYAYRQAVSKGYKNIAAILDKSIKKIEAKREKKNRKALGPIRKRLEAENKRYMEERQKVRDVLKKKKKVKPVDPKSDNFLDSVFGDEEDSVKPLDDVTEEKGEEGKKEDKKKSEKKSEGESKKKKSEEKKVKPLELPTDNDFDVNI